MNAKIERMQVPGERVEMEPSAGFVCTPYVQSQVDRAVTYLEAGYPVHLSGPAGTGKTTLAFHLAALLGRPTILIHGDDEFGSSDLVGRDSGYSRHKVVDNYIHSVLKTEEVTKSMWVDNRLTTACQNGATLIYDEFTRSRPEANNVLLAVLEEGILNVPRLRGVGQGYMNVHPEFRAIFTSNPEDYAGTHKTQDALLDRLITIKLGHLDRESEVQVAMARSGIALADAEVIVDIVREVRGVGVNNHRPSIRAAIAIARVLSCRQAHARLDDPVFVWVCRDVLSNNTAKITKDGESIMVSRVEEAMRTVCERTSGGFKLVEN